MKADCLGQFIAVATLLLVHCSDAFTIGYATPFRKFVLSTTQTSAQSSFRLGATSDGNGDKDELDLELQNILNDNSSPTIFRGSAEDELDEEDWAEIESGKPPEWMVMKEVRRQ